MAAEISAMIERAMGLCPHLGVMNTASTKTMGGRMAAPRCQPSVLETCTLSWRWAKFFALGSKTELKPLVLLKGKTMLSLKV